MKTVYIAEVVTDCPWHEHLFACKFFNNRVIAKIWAKWTAVKYDWKTSGAEYGIMWRVIQTTDKEIEEKGVFEL